MKVLAASLRVGLCVEWKRALIVQNRLLFTLIFISYLRSLVVRAVHRHRTGVGSIPAGGPYS